MICALSTWASALHNIVHLKNIHFLNALCTRTQYLPLYPAYIYMYINMQTETTIKKKICIQHIYMRRHAQDLWVLVSPCEWGVCWVGSGVCWLGAASLLPPSLLLDKIASGSIHTCKDAHTHTHTHIKSFIEIWQSITMDPGTCQDLFWQTETYTERHPDRWRQGIVFFLHIMLF